MIPHEMTRLLQHLHRGGTYGYWWTGNDKRSHWWTVDAPAALPDGRDNIYFGVHPTTEIPPTNKDGEVTPPKFVRSQVAYIAALNCLFGEYDAKDFSNSKAAALAHIDALTVPPSVVIDSGGGYHCYWLLRKTFIITNDDDRARADRAQKGWVDLVGSDDDAKDLARLLRVPGTRNYKKDYAPNYPPVHVVFADYERLYDFEELEALIPEQPPKQPRRSRRVAAATNNQDETGSTADFDTIATTAQLLKRLSTERRDQYSGWLQVGMALRGMGTIGFELWELWSKDSPKYHVGACADKWRTISPNAGITLASLGRWADEDTPPDVPTPETTPETERLRRENDEHKQRERWTRQVLSSDLHAPEKVTLLGAGPQMEACRVLATAPDSPLPMNYEHIAAMTHQSPSTISRTVRKLEAAQVWQCAPEKAIHPDGFIYDKMRLIPLPAFDDPTQIGPPPEQKPHGGKRPGAGRKPRCATCPAGTPIREKTTTTTTVEHVCTGCGELLGEPETTMAKPTYRTIETGDQDAWEAQLTANNQDETGVVPFSLFIAQPRIVAPPTANNQDETGGGSNAPGRDSRRGLPGSPQNTSADGSGYGPDRRRRSEIRSGVDPQGVRLPSESGDMDGGSPVLRGSHVAASGPPAAPVRPMNWYLLQKHAQQRDGGAQ